MEVKNVENFAFQVVGIRAFWKPVSNIHFRLEAFGLFGHWFPNVFLGVVRVHRVKRRADVRNSFL